MLKVNNPNAKPDGFKVEFFADLANHEEQNFWFKGRNKLILNMLNHYSSDFKNYLEIGCGTGFVLSGVAKAFPQANIFGSELFIDGLAFAMQRAPNATCLQMDARDIPFQQEFDVIGSFDVLEHIQEDEIVLAQINKALKPHGIIVITVPQHDWLWSVTDEYACHVRRYSTHEIESKIKAAGFTILRSTSFVSSLLPAMFISRQLNKKTTIENYNPLTEFNMPKWLNSVFEMLLNVDIFLIYLGLNLPLGGSRLVVAQKRDAE